MLEIKKPQDYDFDYDCLDLLVSHLREYIIYQTKRYTADKIDIYLHNTYFRIRYNHKIYQTTILKKDGLYYYYVRPINKLYFTTLAISPKTFEIVIATIKDNDNMLNKKKESQ